jgi:hypothetical protein
MYVCLRFFLLLYVGTFSSAVHSPNQTWSCPFYLSLHSKLMKKEEEEEKDENYIVL